MNMSHTLPYRTRPDLTPPYPTLNEYDTLPCLAEPNHAQHILTTPNHTLQDKYDTLPCLTEPDPTIPDLTKPNPTKTDNTKPHQTTNEYEPCLTKPYLT